MSSSGKKPMVADRRYKKPAGGGKSKPPKESRAKGRAPRRATARRGLSGWIMAFFGLIWRIIWGFTWRAGAVLALIVAGVTFYFYAQMPPVGDMLDARARGSVTLLDRNDKVFAWRGETFGGSATAGNVSQYLHDAVIATEDRRFYRHLGISPRGIASAVRINLREGRGPLQGNGGSTITQQVAKLLCLGVPFDPTQWKSEAEYEADCRKGGLMRKVREVPYAFALEARYTKEEILTIYFNRAYLGAGARGFEAAAQRYFGKSANVVNAAEAAMLAGLLKAPSTYAPTASLQRAQDRAQLVLDLMREQSFLTMAEHEAATRTPATLSEAADARVGTYFADWVMSEGPNFLTKDTTEDVIMRTTLDQRLQTAAEGALAEIFATKVREGSKAEAAVVVMSADGAVRAMVGGRKNVPPGSFNRATMANRQTGSAFKPFVYAAAMDLGYTPADYVEDAPLTINVPGSGPYSPRNYTNRYLGLITLTKALEQSINVAAVRISEAVGRDVVRKVASDFGIESDLAAGPALALGASESTLLEMTGAFAGILNGGSSVRPYGLIDLRLQGDKTPILGQDGGIGERVISDQSAKYLTYMMHMVVEEGTGRRAKLEGRQAAGKTGTTSAARDAWFIGFTADYVAGVWMGYDDNTPLSGVTGGGLPAEIWQEVMTRVHEGMPPRALPMIIPEPRLPPQPQYQDPQYQQQQPQMQDNDPQVQQQPNEAPLADRILQEVLGILGGN
ncbi:PBP1A family penicillin-binding protein [Pseudorhodobacter turbinis]|uniref:peptidoglycan glycosyltransferase n=1 Tax=Pseudorhodobacter turbinis TaxID=2500533 RepID=A0A4P8EGE6_9RHOB|nr:PBP1A family penicillin-binding protein [Pseudorhodobacter turbinis]QCO56231.1 PBP1A family penicillin-binding protein [Pseudorhodobacter turbinis]